MKRLILIAVFSCLILASVSARASSQPFNLHYYGNFKQMVQMKKIDGVVALKTALSPPSTYAVGAIKKGEGEITVFNSNVWLSYGKDGLNKTVRAIPKDEQAALLVTAQVNDWQEVVLPKNMFEPELNQFIVEQAKKHKIDPNIPFPFLLEGQFQDLEWHVIDGLNPQFRGHGGPPPFIQLTEQRKQIPAMVVGFYSAATQGVFTHPGSSWHSHVLFQDENKAGHVDRMAVQKDSILKLPKINQSVGANKT